MNNTNNNNNNNNNNMNQLQKQIQKQRIQKRKLAEKGKNIALTQTVKLWKNEQKIQKQELQKQKIQKQELQKQEQQKQKEQKQELQKQKQKEQKQKKQKQKQKQRHLLRTKNVANKEKAMIYVRLLFPTPNVRKSLPSCVRVNGRPKPASMKYPNMEAIRQKPKRQTKPKKQV